MRRFVLVVGIALCGLLGNFACQGGPISDFPSIGREDDRGPNAGTGSDAAVSVGDGGSWVPGGSDASVNEQPPFCLSDGGLVYLGEAGVDGGVPEAGLDDAGAPDAGDAEVVDAGVTVPDGATAYVTIPACP